MSSMEMDSEEGVRLSLTFHEELNEDDSSIHHNYTQTVGLPYPFLTGISETVGDEDSVDEDGVSRRHSVAIGPSRSESISEEPKLSDEEFSRYCRGLLKICPKNRILMERF
jgi:hypothetical protein